MKAKRIFAGAKALLLCIGLGLGMARSVWAQSISYTNFPQGASAGGTFLFTNSVAVGLTNTLEVTNSLTLLGGVISNAVTVDQGGVTNTSTIFIPGGSNVLTLTRSGAGRLFHIHTNGLLRLNNVVLNGGSSTTGGAIFNEGTLIVTNCVFANNKATNAAGSAGATAASSSGPGGNGSDGGGAAAGAIWSRGTMIVSLSVFSNNTVNAGNGGAGGNGAAEFVFGGDGGNGGNGGSASGGAVVCSGPTNVFFATEFIQNGCAAGSGAGGGSAGAAPFTGHAGSGGSGGSGLGGAIVVAGPLSMTNCLFDANAVTGGTGIQAGGSASGGGMYLSSATAVAYIENTTFFTNVCTAGTGSPAGSASGGALASAADLAQLRNCTLSSEKLTNGATAGWDLARLAGVVKLGNTILFNAQANLTNVLSNTNFTYTTNITNFIDIQGIPVVQTNITTNSVITFTTNVVASSGPNCAGGVVDRGYNISSDTSAKFTMRTSTNAGPKLAQALSANGTTPIGAFGGGPSLTLALLPGSPAIGKIPGIPGLSFPATDQALVPRSTPTSIGSFEAVPLATNGLIPQITAPTTILPTNEVATNTTVTLQAAAVLTNGQAFGYQWQFNGINLEDGGNISGVNTTNLVLKHVTSVNDGIYSLAAGSSTLIGVTNGTPARLRVKDEARIKVQPPARVNAVVGSLATIAVTATGSPPLSYQWFKNGAPVGSGGSVQGATTNALTFNPLSATDAGGYFVIVTNAYGATTSAVTVVTVVSDTIAPQVTITTPALKARTSATLFSGTASDNARVTSVVFWLTNISGTVPTTSNAVPLSAGTGGVSNWSFNLTPGAGTNVLAVQSTDYSGHKSAVVSRPFFFEVTNALVLSRTGDGAGTFSGTASVRGDMVPGSNAVLNVGEAYTLTAIPDKNSFFAGWTGTAGSVTNATLRFIIGTNTSIVATFVTNQFLGMAGSYNGIFYSATLGATEETAGLISGLILGAKGAYSGKVLLAGASYPVSGSFDLVGASHLVIPRAVSKGGAVDVTMTLLFTNTPREITGTVTGSNSVIIPGTNAAGWSSAFVLVAAPSSNIWGSSVYTMLIPPDTTNGALAPPGSGYALLTNHAGVVTITGALADGTAFSQVVPIDEGDQIPLYASLYNNTGLLIGRLSLDGTTNGAPAGNVVWIKKAAATGIYRAGFTNSAAVAGSGWTNIGALDAMIPSGANLTLEGGGLGHTVQFAVALTSANALTRVSGATNALSGGINGKTGLLTLTFATGNGKATAKGAGAILQDQAIGGGFFLGTTNAGAINLSPGGH